MTIFTREISHRIVICILLPLLFFQFLPNVTCQQESASADRNSRPTVMAESVVGIILLALFLLSIVGGCLFHAFHGPQIEARGPEMLHSRSRHGLDKDVIESFPCFLYSEVKGLKIGQGGIECAICLNEFEDEETLRWMPPCSHTFHASCIDVWLASRSTCPVCRKDLSLKPGDSFPHPSTDLETGNAQTCVSESQDDISLISNSVSRNNNENYKTPRSRSTGLLSSWGMAEIFVPRSRSTGHSLVLLGENLDRFTLQLPEEVSLNLIRRSHMALPQARSSRQGYRSGSIGSERSDFSQRRKTLRRATSMSLSFSFQVASVLSTLGKDVREISQAKDNDSGERSFARLMPEKV